MRSSTLSAEPTPIGGSARCRWPSGALPSPLCRIGNEDFFDGSGSYDGRFAQFYDAIKAAYPQLQVIATTGVTSRTPDVLDEHYYRSPVAFENDVHHYDSYSRSGPKIFVGEWASQEGSPTPDLHAAIWRRRLVDWTRA